MKFIPLVFSFLIAGSCAFSQSKVPKTGRPNIMVIMGDDLTFSDLKAYGGTVAKTPNLDRLAAEGMCLDNMFTSTAMCAPTRQQIMTGLYPVRNGAYPNHSQVYPTTKSVAHYMQEMGYNAGLIGKKHFGPEQSFPYDFLGGRDGDNGKGQDIDLTKAEAYIKKSGNKPYFLMVTSNQTHTPWNRGDASAYPPASIKVPAGFEDTPLTRQSLSKYYAEITYLDSLVGVCLDIVERSGQKDNTIVIFTSEQGNSFPFAKWTCYDKGLQTAFIARWPKHIKAGSRNAAMTQYVDVVPTLIDMAGADPTKINTGTKDAAGYAGFDGKSFKNVLFGQVSHFRDFVFGVHTTRGIINGSEAYAIRSARNNKYLYIHNLNYMNAFSNTLINTPLYKSWMAKNPTGRALFYQQRPEEELYDIQKDPSQLNNLAAKPTFAREKNTLKAALSVFMKQQGDRGIPTEMDALSRQPKHAEKD